MKRNKLIVYIMLIGLVPLTYDFFAVKITDDLNYPKPTGKSTDNISPSQESKLPGLRLAMFDIDVTPPVGYEMAFDTVINTWDLGLRARGIVLPGAGKPVVMCAFGASDVSSDVEGILMSAIRNLLK